MSEIQTLSPRNIMPFIFATVVGFVLFVGWRLRDYRLITAEDGVGYWLGITGCVFMLLLLVYPLRKRVKTLQKIGSVKTWFRTHMMLGILGPLCIVFHSNFHLGSLNSQVALFSMLIVSGSGIAGRYFYRKIHHGLYGRRADLEKLKEDMAAEEERIGNQLGLIEGIKDELFQFSQNVLITPRTLGGSIAHAFNVNRSAVTMRRKIEKNARNYIKAHAMRFRWSARRKRQMMRQVERKVRKMLRKSINVAEFSCYERLFALWHVLHVPLFFIMVGTIIVHIVAVHQY